MSNRHSYADYRRDETRLRAVTGASDPLPAGPALGLAGFDRPVAPPAALPGDANRMPETVRGPAVVTALDCETETSKVDDWRVSIGKVLGVADWAAGTILDAHVDLAARRVWLRPPHEPVDVCDCDCQHRIDATTDPRRAIPGVDAVMDGAVKVQSRGRMKVAPNLLKLLGADRHAGRITATTVSDLDAVLLVGAADYLRRLLPDLTGSDAASNVVALHPNP